MIWKYYIPHDWQGSSTCVWEDVWLIPAPGQMLRGLEFGESLWFTVDALGRPEDSIFPNEHEDALAELGDKPYVIEASDMIVKAERLTKEDVLKWAKVWLEHEGFEVTGFEESTLEEF